MLGRHIQTQHPAFYVPKVSSAKRLAAKALQAHSVATEMKRLAKRGIRLLPKSRLDASTRMMVNAWLKRLSESANVSENLLIAGMEKSERGIQSQREFKALQASIIQASKLGDDSLPGLYARSTHFNPTVAGEILKLAFLLNKSWSFATHLLLLYGLESLAEQLATTGALPPLDVSSPSRSLAEAQKEAGRERIQSERNAAFESRNPGFDPDTRPKPYVVKQKYDI